MKHIEKTRILLHCIDATSNNIKEDYVTVRNELEKYNPELLKKEEVILLTKTDLIEEKEVKKIITQVKKLNKNIMPISIINENQVKELKKIILK